MLNLATFRVQFPEFNSAPDPLVQSRLDQAERRINSEVWGPKENDGHGMLTAHLLALSIFGQMAKLQSKTGETTYGVQFEAMEIEVAGFSFRVT